MATMIKLVLSVLVLLQVSTETESLSFGGILEKLSSYGSWLADIVNEMSSKLPSEILQFVRPVSPTSTPSSDGLPSFCSEYDCPRFYEMKINASSDYTLRCYPKPYKWVSTTVQGKASKEAGRTAFWKLFRYIQGSNEGEMKIKMTVPVTNSMQLANPGSNTFCKRNFTMSFFIPYKHQEDAPAPTNDDVHLSVVQPFCAYVKVYGGYSNIRKVKENYEALVKSLKKDHLDSDFSNDTFYTAGYDSPMKLFNRHNEIWIVSKTHSPNTTENGAEDFEIESL